MTDDVVYYEVFEENKPSYLPAYVMSAFVLIGLVSVAHAGWPLWPLSLAHLFLAVWFGVLFAWILRDARQGKLFTSNRLLITRDTLKHSFRYAVAEATFAEIPVADIEEVRIPMSGSRFIEVVGTSGTDLYFLPESAVVDELVAALRVGNAAIRVTWH